MKELIKKAYKKYLEVVAECEVKKACAYIDYNDMRHERAEHEFDIRLGDGFTIGKEEYKIDVIWFSDEFKPEILNCSRKLKSGKYGMSRYHFSYDEVKETTKC